MKTNLDSKTAYKLLHTDLKMPISEASDRVYQSYGYLVSDSTGTEILVIQTDSEILVTTSRAFIRTFLEMVELFPDSPKFRVLKKISKNNNRPYYECSYVE